MEQSLLPGGMVPPRPTKIIYGSEILNFTGDHGCNAMRCAGLPLPNKHDGHLVKLKSYHRPRNKSDNTLVLWGLAYKAPPPAADCHTANQLFRGWPPPENTKEICPCYHT